MLNGYRVISNASLFKQEFNLTWFGKLINFRVRWNPCDEFHNQYFTLTSEPDPNVYIMNGCLVAHPAVIAAMKESLTPIRTTE